MISVIFYDQAKNLISANKMDFCPRIQEVIHVDNNFYMITNVIHKIIKNEECKVSHVYLKQVPMSDKFKN